MTTATVTKDVVLEALHDVFDPEIPVNVVDLGLIYGVEVEEEKAADLEHYHEETYKGREKQDGDQVKDATSGDATTHRSNHRIIAVGECREIWDQLVY